MKRSVLALLAFALVALPACDNADPNPDPDPDPGVVQPTVPPAAAFAFDDSFPEGNAPGVNGGQEHFNNGAFRVGIVSLAVGVHLIVPSAATGAATEVSPFVENGTWIWENTVRVANTDVTCRLEGTPEGTSVDWRMLISSDDLGGVSYDDFVLYTATTALNGRSGSWSLFYRIDGTRTGVLDADYEVRSEFDRMLTFSIPQSNPNPDARGDSVQYGADGSDRSFDWDEAPGQTHFVEWDALTRAGSITAWNYNEGEQACWGSDLQNTSCN